MAAKLSDRGNYRAMSRLEVKSIVSEERRIISGIASTPVPDRVSDEVISTGMQVKLPVPLLWQHDHSAPCGECVFAEATTSGIPFVAQMAKLPTPGSSSLFDVVERAWDAVRNRLVKHVSIGFLPLKSEPIKGSNGRRFTSWELLELSICTVPTCRDAEILEVRSLDLRRNATSKSFKSDPALDAVRQFCIALDADFFHGKLRADTIKLSWLPANSRADGTCNPYTREIGIGRHMIAMPQRLPLVTVLPRTLPSRNA